MLLINNINTDPYFNIAAEEYLLKQKKEEIILLYINSPSVIVGKHQNALAEINYKYVLENKIPVIRRISGGGTVYHDFGNLNFTVITNEQPEELINFQRSIQPIRNALEKLGIETTTEGKNNICVNGLKISGNAAHVYKNRVMHHGTLLVSTDIAKLNNTIDVNPGKYVDNGVKSIRSSILNLENVNQIDIEEFRKSIIEELSKGKSIENYSFTTNDKNSINQLIAEKYNTWDWNFGYSPSYEFFNNKAGVYFKVEKGIISEAKVDFLNDSGKNLIGNKHEYNNLLTLLKSNSNYTGNNLKKVVWKFF
jgi:lipoate-protein ligase A